MGQLQTWFNDRTLVALVLSGITVGVSLIAVGVSIRVFKRQNRTDAMSIDLQRRLTEIEEARRTEEVARKTEADIRASFRRERSDFFDGWDTFLDIENRGGAAAHNVNLESLQERPSGSNVMVPEQDAIFPLSEMLPGHKVTCGLSFPMDSGNSYEAVVTWDDPRGPQRRTIPLTR